jgi:putative nucleotidyltransferase with HDIG domain
MVATAAGGHLAQSARELRTKSITSFIEASGEVAVLPPTAQKLLRLSNDPNATLDNIATVIRTDPTLATKILAMANSVAYGAGGSGGSWRIVAIDRAVSRIGMQAIRAVALHMAMSGRVVRVPGLEEYIAWLSRHAIFTAVAARAIAKKIGLDAELAFLTGLLHDLGASVALEAYSKLQPEARSQLCFESRGLRPLVDAVHAEIGAHAMKRWGLPEVVVAAGLEHHANVERIAPKPMTALVYVADAMAHEVDPQPEEVLSVAVREMPIAYQIGLDERAIRDISRALPEDGRELIQALR